MWRGVNLSLKPANGQKHEHKSENTHESIKHARYHKHVMDRILMPAYGVGQYMSNRVPFTISLGYLLWSSVPGTFYED